MDMKYIFKLGFTLFATCVVVAGLQGLVNGITLVEFIKYVARICPKEIRGFAIAVYYSFGFSVSTILCQLIGGFLLEQSAVFANRRAATRAAGSGR